MDVKTVTKGANPFLIDDLTEYSHPSQLGGGGGGMNSNPFLSGSDFNISGTSDNPFLSSLGGVDVTESVSPSPFSTTSTNPFALSSSDNNESNANIEFFSAVHEPVVSESQNIVSSDALSNIFDNMQVKQQVVSSADIFFDVGPTSIPQTTANFHEDRVDLLDDTFSTTTTDHPEGFCKETADLFTNVEVSDDASSRTSTPKGGPPRRPPPPRPPPSKETKDLILSVTGAMEATSSHLLDRLQATRTPSPTPIRDLHSPSPTPDVSFSDFLVGEPTDLSQSKLAEFPSSEDFSLLGDADMAPSSGIPATQQPQVPPRPARPPTQPTAQISAAVNADMMDIFSSEAQPEVAPKKSNTDILGLFNTSAPETTKPESSVAPPTTTDLLGDVFEEGLENKPLQEMNVMASSTTDFANFSSEAHTATELSETVSPKVSDSLPVTLTESHVASGEDDFDAFAAKFENAAKDEVLVASDPFDPFSGSADTEENDLFGNTAITVTTDVWGSTGVQAAFKTEGFGEGDFDSFLTMNEPTAVAAVATAADAAVAPMNRIASADSDEGPDFSVFIKPKTTEEDATVPALAPPPKSPVNNSAFADSTPRFNPFDKSSEAASAPLPCADAVALPGGEPAEGGLQRTDSQETPPTPLFDDDVSQPLEDFPRTVYTGDGWEMHLRQPNKKKITGQRFWKKVFVRLVSQGDNPVLQLYNTKDDKDPFQELPLQACYSVSDIGAQQFDMYGKIFTVKLQYVFYKERPGVRPGQVTKAERLTNKLSQFAAYAIQGDYQGCKEFGSDLRKLGLPVEHAPQISQLFKIGCQSYEDLKQFCMTVEESLFRMSAHRDRALNYKTEEVQITAVDELYVEQDRHGHIDKQIARVRLFFLAFLAGMPDVELGLNDMWRQGKEVVGRHDIIPVITEEWIRLENTEFHSCVQQDEYQRTHTIKFKPPDACYIELMRFRVRPPKNRELPLQVKAVLCVTGNKVQLKADILVPGFSSRKLGQIPCEDVMVRFPIPECWIYLFRVEKHFRYGSVKSTHRRTGKVKGIERLLGAVETLEQSLIEVTSGQAKYEHQHRAIVWRMSRLPKEGQGAYTTHALVCNMALTSYDQIPDQLAEYCYVEFTMPATQVSHTTVRSVSLVDGAKDDPPEKYVRYLARHEYRVGIEHTQGEGPSAYITATITKPAPAAVPETVEEEKHEVEAADSDSDSSS